MPRRSQHYDPIVESGPPPPVEMPPVRCQIVEAPGAYLLSDDVSAVLLRMAEQYHQEGRDALLAASEYFRHLERIDATQRPQGAPAGLEGAAEEDGCGARLADGPDELIVCSQHIDGYHAGVNAAGRVVAWSTESPHPIETVAAPDPPAGVDRVEVYPNEDASYWWARPVGPDGAPLQGERDVSGIRREEVVAEAGRAWPGAPIHEIASAMGDSIWDEQDSSTTFSGQRRPSTQRLFGR